MKQKNLLNFSKALSLISLSVVVILSGTQLPANANWCESLGLCPTPPTPPRGGNPILDTRVFQWGFYVRSYEDLRREFGVRDSTTIRNHWTGGGFVEGRQGAPAFSARYYLTSNPDLGAAFGTTGRDAYLRAVQHWRAGGISECRKSSPFYDGRFYLENNPDLRQAFGNDCPRALLHWLNGGIAEGRVSAPGWNPRERVREYGLPDTPDGYIAAMQEYLKRGGN